jgi:transaldolase
LDPQAALQADLPAVHLDEAAFRWALNEDAMATEKLAEGIRAFAVDAAKLDRMIEGLRS